MKWFLFLIFILSSPFAGASDQVVRVLLDENIKSLEFSTVSPLRIQSALSETLELNQGKSKITIQKPKKGNNDKKNDSWEVTVYAQGIRTQYSLAGHSIKLSGGPLIWDHKIVDFPITVLSKGSRFFLVGNMSMNRYLRGVIPHEMPSSWPVEAVKAQTIASRTYALWKMKHSSYSAYDLKPSVSDQVFRMERVGLENRHSNVEKALVDTEGQYLTAGDSQVIKAYFHSDCGGDTESAVVVWGKPQALTASVRDVACEKRNSVWATHWTLERLKEKMRGEYFLPGDLTLTDVIVRQQSKSQRVEHVDMLFTKGVFKRLRGEDLRRLLGYDKLKSTLFDVQKNGNEIVFSGRGHGHGVGMCQWGTRAMASSGKTSVEILKHYYPGTKIITSPDVQPATTAVESQSVSAL